jgi:hypothetical protein
MPESPPEFAWPKGGWEEAEMNTLRHGAGLSLYQMLQWLEEIEEVFLCLQQSRQSDVARPSRPLAVAEGPPPSAKEGPAHTSGRSL